MSPPADRPYRSRSRSGLLLAFVLLASVLASCNAHQGGLSGRVRGIVIAVEARSVAQTEAITLRTDDGRELTFRLDPGVEVTPGHLREHMALGEPIVVDYRPSGDGLLAMGIEDG